MKTINKCIICDKSKFQTVTSKGFLFTDEKVMLCENCGQAFLSPQMDEIELEQFYKSNTFSKELREGEKPSNDIVEYSNKRAKLRYEQVAEYINNDAVVLEIGSGSGAFLNCIKDKTSKLYGLEPSTAFAEFARDTYDLNVSTNLFPNLPADFPQKFDCIAIFHVFEHLTNPQESIAKIHSLLKPGGLLFIEVPDLYKTISCRKSLVPTYFHKAHLWDFNTESMKYFLQKNSFKFVNQISFGNKAPLDKNMLFVAQKHDQSIVESISSEFNVLKFYKTLKFKLFLGSIKSLIKKLIKRKNKFHN